MSWLGPQVHEGKDHMHRTFLSGSGHRKARRSAYAIGMRVASSSWTTLLCLAGLLAFDFLDSYSALIQPLYSLYTAFIQFSRPRVWYASSEVHT